MRKIFLVLGILLITDLFAKSPSDNWVGAVLKCEQSSMTEKALKTAIVDNCLEAINILKNQKNKNKYLISVLGESYYNAAVIYEYAPKYNHNYKKAVEMLRKAIELDYDKYGNGVASFKLGVYYFFGHGVNKNYIKAYKYFKRAAEYGFPKAQNALELLCNRVAPWACR